MHMQIHEMSLNTPKSLLQDSNLRLNSSPGDSLVLPIGWVLKDAQANPSQPITCCVHMQMRVVCGWVDITLRCM